MKVLIYNWVQFDDPGRRGGGVTVYLYDLIAKMSLESDCQCFFLSSGLDYTFDGKVRIEKTENCFSDRVKSFKIINSPVHAPACVQFYDLGVYLTDTSLLELLKTFWDEQQGFDIVHFHNLEGLSLPVLKLKEFYPNTKFIYSLHNYFLFCPQVNLWTNSDENCYCTSQFPMCENCVVAPSPQVETFISTVKSVFPEKLRNQDNLIYRFVKGISKTFRKLSVQQGRKSASALKPLVGSACNIFSDFRSLNVAYANKYFDHIIAVSRQVKEIAYTYGIQKEKLLELYIGTVAASNSCTPRNYNGKLLRVGYLGYARADKGFNSLLEALTMLSLESAAKMDIILAAKCESQEIYCQYNAKIASISDRFHHVRFMNGYAKSEQHTLLDQIDVGIIPNLWEDNLPQIAIEYIAYGIPIIVSDAGGAKELCRNDDFIYKADDYFELVQKLEKFALNPQLLALFWGNKPKLTTMEEHIKALRMLYFESM